MNYIIGIDVGIGSIGWAIINLDKKRIEDVGVRIFESGENAKERKSMCQERRTARGIRRLIRRRNHRKSRLKKHLELIGLTTENKINEYFINSNSNVIALRVKAISEKISPEELAACLINICNYRGYKDFYSTDSIDYELLSKEERQTVENEMKALDHIKQLMKKGNYRTPAEMIYKDPEFESTSGEFRKYHNSKFSEQINLISRDMLQREVELILEKQKEFYNCLDDNNTKKTIDIIFSQRAFEEGPGDKNDEFRKYTGFLDSIGKCSFYSEENRGSRFTAIADVYALVNTLSQYKYFNEDGEFCFDSKIAQSLISFALKNGNMTKNDIKSIAKQFKIKINDSGTSDTPITKCFRYLKSVKPIFENAGYDWNELIKDYTDTENNLLNRVGITLSKYITPRIRIDELRKLPISEELVIKLARMKFTGTTNVSYKYMTDSINAFLEGDIYGKYQAGFIKDNCTIANESEKPIKLPPFRNEDDCEFINNPVVFRAINETRKVINAIINKYGYPCAVNIETADEVNRSFADRDADRKRNSENEKNNDRIRKNIAEIINEPIDCVRPVQIEKYKLWEAQDGKCLYSGKEIDKEAMLKDNDRLFEIDHIVPYSLILDNTINNKALVYLEENQIKGQQTPLMYMRDEQAKGFKSRVNAMLKANKCSKRKYQYLMLADLTNSELLDEWRSRNLNDTRYISKYLVNYLKNNLRFNPQNEFADGFKITEGRRVFAVKSKFTSQFRKLWLNPKTWGKKDKSKLKEITYLDHAADAIVIANCRPEFIIISGEKMKLNSIYKNAGKIITDEYTSSFNNCISNLVKYYGMNRKLAESYLKDYRNKLPAIIPNIADETDNRLRDFNTHRMLFDDLTATDEEIVEIFKTHNIKNYSDDLEFAKSLKMPVISYKPERKYTGEITATNPISIQEIDHKIQMVVKKNINTLKAKEFSDIRSDDKDLINSLKSVFDNKEDDYTIEKYLNDNGLKYFTTLKGRRINRVTLIQAPPSRYYTKQISNDNYSIIDDRKYYCIEIYKTNDNKNNMLGISLTDVIKKNGKLWLKPDYKYPQDYKEHIMYLFKGDYIILYESNGEIKFEGYYLSAKNINRNMFYNIRNNSFENNPVQITQKVKCIKLNVDILGKVSGYNNGEGISCGEPLSLLKEKE